MVEKTYDKNNNIVDFFSASESSLASPARAVPLDAVARNRHGMAQSMDDKDGMDAKDDTVPPFDFAFHGPTAKDIYVLKIIGFSTVMAVVVVSLGFGIASGVSRLFS